MKIFYILSGYISHRQAGLEYIACLQSLGHEVSCNYPAYLEGGVESETLSDRRCYYFADEEPLLEAARAADLVILHEDPSWHDLLFRLVPWLAEKPLVIYLPWENAKLPENFVRPLRRARRIWTPSDFCRQAFLGAGFTAVDVLPHVVRRPRPSAGALAWVRALLAEHGLGEGGCLFLSVVDGLNPRKNLEGLLTAFNIFQGVSGAPARLLLKQYRAAMALDAYEGVINVTETLDDAHMAALYALCTAYVSAHRTEGWGLGLSTAMSFGKIAIATAYSGNLEFMDAGNSILIPYGLTPVSEQMAQKIPLFSTDMLWASPDLGLMAEAMRRVAEGRVEPGLSSAAAQITRRYGLEAVAGRMQGLIELLSL